MFIVDVDTHQTVNLKCQPILTNATTSGLEAAILDLWFPFPFFFCASVGFFNMPGQENGVFCCWNFVFIALLQAEILPVLVFAIYGFQLPVSRCGIEVVIVEVLDQQQSRWAVGIIFLVCLLQTEILALRISMPPCLNYRVRSHMADKRVKFRDPRLNHFREIPPQAVGGGIFERFIMSITSDRK